MNMMTNVFEKLIDFTRTSAGGYYGPDGLFRMTPASKNLLTYTQELDNAAWVNLGAVALPFDPALISLGSERAVNGDFSGGVTGWTFASGASVMAGQLDFSAVAASTGAVNSFISTPGVFYLVTFTVVSIASGVCSAGFGTGTPGAVRSSPGTYSEYIVGNGTALSVFARGSSFTGVIDNVSVKEVSGGLITAPDGTLTADALVATAGASTHRALCNGAVAGSQQAYSVYAKAGSHRYLQINSGASAAIFANFDLLTGAVGTVGAFATAAIESVGNGWYRCSIVATPASIAGARMAMVTSASASYDESWTATGTESFYLWGAQIELGSAATSYARNFGGLFPPRFDYDPVTKAPRGLLVEEQRTNLLLYSEQFENASWVKKNLSVTANAAVSPDGIADADRLVEDTATDSRHIYQAATMAAATTYVLTVYAKAAERSVIQITSSVNFSGSGTAYQNFDLSNGTLGGSSGGKAASITPVGNGWYRCSYADTSVSAASGQIIIAMVMSGTAARLQNYTGDGTSGIYLWGAQLEAGAFPTSYIPTVASQVTRAADIATITGANFSNWYNQSEGTFVVEADSVVPTVTSTYVVVSANDGTGLNQNRMFVYFARWGGSTSINGVNQSDLQVSSSYSPGVVGKTVYAYRANDFAVSANGSVAITDTSGSVPSPLSQASFGAGGVNNSINGHIRSIKYYPTRLGNAQLQTLSA